MTGRFNGKLTEGDHVQHKKHFGKFQDVYNLVRHPQPRLPDMPSGLTRWILPGRSETTDLPTRTRISQCSTKPTTVLHKRKYTFLLHVCFSNRGNHPPDVDGSQFLQAHYHVPATDFLYLGFGLFQLGIWDERNICKTSLCNLGPSICQMDHGSRSLDDWLIENPSSATSAFRNPYDWNPKLPQRTPTPHFLPMQNTVSLIQQSEILVTNGWATGLVSVLVALFSGMRGCGGAGLRWLTFLSCGYIWSFRDLFSYSAWPGWSGVAASLYIFRCDIDVSSIIRVCNNELSHRESRPANAYECKFPPSRLSWDRWTALDWRSVLLCILMWCCCTLYKRWWKSSDNHKLMAVDLPIIKRDINYAIFLNFCSKIGRSFSLLCLRDGGDVIYSCN